ncbi:MAG: RsmB/NOP family class I SAM-dependent RNA methyltransferase [Opitutales bacterium]
MKLRIDRKEEASGWWNAVRLISEFSVAPAKAENFLRRAQSLSNVQQKQVCQHLFLGAIRHHLLLNWLLRQTVKRDPRPMLKAVLHVAGFELVNTLERGESEAPCIHFAVGQTKKRMSPGEASLVNAVLRKWVKLIGSRKHAAEDDDPKAMSLYFSHPEWLVKRWVSAWGFQDTRKLLRYNQTPASVYVRAFTEIPERDQPSLAQTDLPEFFKYTGHQWDSVQWLLDRGRVIVQDPATRLATDAIDPQAGDVILDLCAAPGGKSLNMAARVGAEGRVYGMDQGRDKIGARYFQWETNVSRALHQNVAIFEADILEITDASLAKASYPTQYDKVLLDAPCSNTGVLNRKPDARLRLSPDQISNVVPLQQQLLARAATWVKPGGVLVYSTCSLEKEENEDVVSAFLESEAGSEWTLESQCASLPFRDGFDGAGVAKLRRSE